MTIAPELQFSLLTEPIIRYRRASDGETVKASLPELFVALAADEVRDYPALRPHQRHPWHAFLVQLAAIALHKAERTAGFETAQEWRDALLALTPDDPDGAAWCLVSPPDRPALLQAAVSVGLVKDWDISNAADSLDMLITSKNHDLKQERMRRGSADDWLFSLVSLQTQEGFGGRDNFGITRMAGSFGSRTAVGAVPSGNVGRRWQCDVAVMLNERDRIAENYSYKHAGGISLVWTIPWDGSLGAQISMQQLDPLYIEICRQVRLAIRPRTQNIFASTSSSKASRISSGDRQGVTGDIWTSVNELAKPFGAALKIRARGFDYKLSSSLLFGIEYGSGERACFYSPTSALKLNGATPGQLSSAVLCGVSRGGPTGNKSVTQGYHERRLPISPKVRSLLITNQKAQLGRIAGQRIAAISEVRKLLWLSLVILFANGNSRDNSVGDEAKASKFSAPFELVEDTRFFDDLNEEIEATDPAEQRLQWLLGVVERAEAILKAAFNAGPRSGIQKYRAQSAALSRFHGGLRSDKFPIPDLVNYYRQQTIKRQEETRDNA
ncbi:type I-E CRISPR-associated protein Cse1/CasA [Rhodoferax sp.]|uniref:type I-E CRISPR-associated protein Cse1/CasA n=1 Tax=Rhodoferax sp. TaxID=50421 RepID=UPI00261BFC8E|nr:type I-E CRISPR-associated protein Cse1/CasA [Rhodoferax sp.]MDD5000356.1 type I-E CRISPR-associated protein Cse1/CasA [Thiomonas arsenitoxydans]MDD5480270.1 type I-E CRISPR-associated protein Cse1/CasA [Rhodoferax sp.]